MATVLATLGSLPVDESTGYMMCLEPLCLGSVMGEKDVNGTFPPADTVTLILDKSAVKRSSTIQISVPCFRSNSYPEYGFRSLPIRLIEQRFEERYRERARQVGADALIVKIADRMKFESPVILGAPATTTYKGEKVRLYFDAIKYAD